MCSKIIYFIDPLQFDRMFLLHGKAVWDKGGGGGRERRVVLPINFLIVLCRLSVWIPLSKWGIFFIFVIYATNNSINTKYQNVKIILKTML